MANNRMFLVHRPTGIGIMLGKHMGRGWYSEPKEGELRVFYEYLEHNHEQPNNLFLGMEDPENNLCVEIDYTREKVDGYIVLKVTGE